MKGRSNLVAGLAAAVLSLGFAACGGGDDEEGNETFREDGFDVTFSYPADFDLSTEIEGEYTAGEGAEAGAGLELESKNGVYITRFGKLNVAVTRANLAVAKSGYDPLVSQLAGRPLEAQETEQGGLPALSYPPFETGGVTNRTAVVFDGNVPYQINCQWEDENRAEVEDACDLALRTLRESSG